MISDMTEDEKSIVEALASCKDARLPDDFADRLARRIRENGEKPANKTIKTTFTRLALIAASATLILGFVPGTFDGDRHQDGAVVANCDILRPTETSHPENYQLNGLAFLGFCHEVIRRRFKPLVRAFQKREDDVED